LSYTFLLLAVSVLSPKGTGSVDVSLLALFGATDEQNYQNVAIKAKVNPVPWSEIYPVF
jgi:hypothetical protein